MLRVVCLFVCSLALFSCVVVLSGCGDGEVGMVVGRRLVGKEMGV